MARQSNHEESVLSKKQISWKKDALELAIGLVEKYSEIDSDYFFEPNLLDAAFENVMKQNWWKRPRNFILITGFGYALGQSLVDRLGFEWIVYKDYQGKDIAVKHQKSGIICFPISAVRKRIKSKDYRFMEVYTCDVERELISIAKEIDKLQFISQGKDINAHLKSIESACQGGCKWVQLRLKKVSYEEYLETAIAAKEICQKHQVKLTINDNTQVALESKADGLHLGKQDMSPSEARKIVGDIIIGGTANTWEDIVYLAEQKVDYIGLGPFRFTNTKETLSPILGIEGYDKLLQKMKIAKIDIPVLAIGGIELEDIQYIVDIGVWGIAVSGLLVNAKDKKKVCDSIFNQLVN